MSTQTDFDRIARAWLEEGPALISDRVLQAALDEVHQTTQRRLGALWRTFTLDNRTLRMGAAGALLVIVVAVAAIYFAGNSRAPAVGATSSPPATAAPTSPASASPSPAVASSPVPAINGLLPLPAGTYLASNMKPLRVTVTVPDGWEAWQNWSVLKSGEDPNRMAVGFYNVRNIYSDPCHWQDAELDPPLGATSDDLVAAMVDRSERSPRAPVKVTVGGLEATLIEWSVPVDARFAECDQGEYRSWTTMDESGLDFGARYQQAPGQVDRIYVLQVGDQRMVIDAYYLAGTSASDLAELQAIVDSVTIEGPAE